MNKSSVIIILIVVVLLGVGGYLYFNRTKSASTSTTVAACTPAAGEATFTGKVAYVDQYKQYTLVSGSTTYYLNTTSDAQALTLQSKIGQTAQVNGTRRAVTGNPRAISNDINVTTVCP
ncbi:MAG: hypothetical protein Q7S37_00810 [bacterium]|nr:hypothetical protein [bacterium]